MSHSSKLLGINVDHVATLRQQRKQGDPDLLTATKAALASGADSITVHLREDRRHIQDQDVYDLMPIAPRLNFEMSIAPEIVAIAKDLRPYSVCLVPEKREELTTEGGLDVVGLQNTLSDIIPPLKEMGTMVSLFVDPNQAQLEASQRVGADYIELHTGDYANSHGEARLAELQKVVVASKLASELGLGVNAGHGLNYENVSAIVEIPEIEELNIGHSIISRALLIGIGQAVSEMKALLSV